MRQDLCNGTVSVCPSVGLSHLSTAEAAYGGFAAGRPAGRQYQWIAARRACSNGAAAARRTAANASSVTFTAAVEG